MIARREAAKRNIELKGRLVFQSQYEITSQSDKGWASNVSSKETQLIGSKKLGHLVLFCLIQQFSADVKGTKGHDKSRKERCDAARP